MSNLDYSGGGGGMNESTIRRIVQQEINKSNNATRFNLSSVSNHAHDGIDSPKIQENNIVPPISVSGSITFSSVAIYTLTINAAFTPSSIFCTGNVVGSGTERYIFTGTAQLGRSFYFQPQDNRTVVAGGPQYPFHDPNNPDYGSNIPMQSCTYYGSESNAGARHTLVGNFHIIDIQYPLRTSHARATVIDFNKNAISIAVETLDSGWEINANFVIT